MKQDSNRLQAALNDHKPHRGSVMDVIFKWGTFIFAFAIVLVLLWMLIDLVIQSKLSIRHYGFHFIISTDWDPVHNKFGALPYIYGTTVSSLIAILFATPISVGIALFLTEMAPRWLRTPVGFLVELLAAIPSILLGLWGVYVFIPFLRKYLDIPLSKAFGWFPLFSGPPIGLGMLTAGLLLAIMIIPIITALARDVISNVPVLQKEGALALGSTKWEMMWKVVLPISRSGILGAVILGLGRALGETMAVTMVIGNIAQIKPSLLVPAHSMAAVIANEFTEAAGDLYLSSLIEIGLLLFLVTFILNSFARFLIWRITRGPSGRSKS